MVKLGIERCCVDAHTVIAGTRISPTARHRAKPRGLPDAPDVREPRCGSSLTLSQLVND